MNRGAQARDLPILPSYPEWKWDAKCAGRNPGYYETDNIPFRANSPQYWAEAKNRCAGCPVKRQCAEDAIYYQDLGTIRAGEPLQHTVARNDALKMYDRLQNIVDGKPNPDYPERVVNQRLANVKSPVFDWLPGPSDPTPVEIEGFWYVSRVGAAEILGVTPRALDNYRHNKTLELATRVMRRHKRAGTGSTFFLVDELQQAKEKIRDRKRRKARSN